MNDQNTDFRHWHTIRSAAFHETGPDGRVRLDVFADWFQGVGGEHAGALGLNTDVLLAKGLGWALRRLTVNIARLPAGDSTVHINTWPAARDKLYFHRDFRINDERNDRVATATTRWGLFDLESRRAVPTPDWMAALVPIDATRVDDFESGPIATLGDRADVAERAVPPRWADLDLNGHVNNARLVSWLLEGLPRETVATGRLVALDVAFRAECRLDDRVLSRAAAVADGCYRHALVNEETGTDIVRAETVWR